MPPAARITDMHTCPMVDPGPKPHVGGPVASGAPTVFIGYIPAARVNDTAVCVGPMDSISAGSSNVVISNQNAARIGDPTKHGGVIVAGCPTVIIGESTQSFTLKAAAASGAPFCEECEKARKAAEEARKAQEPPPPPSKVPADSVDAKSAEAAGLSPKTAQGPATPFSPTAEETALAAAPGDSPPQRAAREKVLRDFYEQHKDDGLGQARADQDMGVGGKPPRPNGSPLGYGVDLGKPMQVIKFPPPDVMHQYVRKEGVNGGKPGNFFDPKGDQIGDEIGLNTDPVHRKPVTFKVPPGEGLYSGCGPIVDTWTDKKKAVLTPGGGVQVTVPHGVKRASACHRCGQRQCSC